MSKGFRFISGLVVVDVECGMPIKKNAKSSTLEAEQACSGCLRRVRADSRRRRKADQSR
jgi:hypothetical protein